MFPHTVLHNKDYMLEIQMPLISTPASLNTRQSSVLLHWSTAKQCMLRAFSHPIIPSISLHRGDTMACLVYHYENGWWLAESGHSLRQEPNAEEETKKLLPAEVVDVENSVAWLQLTTATRPPDPLLFISISHDHTEVVARDRTFLDEKCKVQNLQTVSSEFEHHSFSQKFSGLTFQMLSECSKSKALFLFTSLKWSVAKEKQVDIIYSFIEYFKCTVRLFPHTLYYNRPVISLG